MTSHAPDSRPTRVRYGVLAFLCTLSFVLYLDRVCISQAADTIQSEFSMRNERWSYVLMAFTLAYGLFEIPTGHMGDRFGARKVLTRIVVWWSAFTVLTAACWGFWSLVVVRFLFGAGEAGAYPNAARVLARWFPPGERGRAQGLVLASGLTGGRAWPALAAYLLQAFGWRAAFVAFGGVGVVWAFIFAAWFRDNPADHPAVNAAERDRIGSDVATAGGHRIPWRLVFRQPVIWILGTIITFNAFVSYVYFSWYPKYLQAGRSVEKIESGWRAAWSGWSGAGRCATGSRAALRRWRTGGCGAFAPYWPPHCCWRRRCGSSPPGRRRRVRQRRFCSCRASRRRGGRRPRRSAGG